jgi:hypothetical protein
MKKTKRVIPLVLAFTMLFSTIAFARYDSEDYNYRKTTDLEASIEDGKITLTWPAVNKSGELINANPLESTSSYGNPMAGWTNPTQGMVIEYPNWKIDGTHTGNPTQLNTGECRVLYGLTDSKVTDYPVVVTDAKTGEEVKDAYLSDEVVSENFATAYRIEISKDGVNWTTDQTVTTVNHGKKMNRRQEDGTIKADSKTTFFLEDQFVEQLKTDNLDADTEYQIKVTATNAAKTTDNYKEFTTTITTASATTKYPAFPTVEGGGIYSQGGRGTTDKPGDVYVVTNLTDSVSNPQPGSLRYGLKRLDRADKDSTYPRTITFAVSGVINVDSTAAKSERHLDIGSNTTIAGQTAPGEGITIYGATAKFSGENIICRYLRFRLGEGYDADAATAGGENIVIDHCTFNWGVDESFSAKEIIKSSIQYNIIANSLAFPNKTGVNNSDAEIASGESEAKHGMGSILNGSDVTYTHNLWANHGTRNPRFEGGFTYDGITYGNKLTFANNVIYNWGHNSGYGGERGNGNTNIIGNYYKPGPNTLEKVYTRIFDVDGNTSKYYVSGNVMTSDSDVTADNSKGMYDASSSDLLSSPVELTYPYEAEDAESAYNNVLNSVGDSLHRDAHDSRLIEDVKNGTGRMMNNEFEAGGILNVGDSSVAPTDSDGDGMPDSWEDKMGLNKNDPSDAGLIVDDETKSYNGYSNIEVYCNSLVGEWAEFDTVAAKTNDVFTGLTVKDENGVVVGDSNSANITLAQGKTYTVSYNKSGNGGVVSVLLNNNVMSTGTDSFTPDTTGRYNLAVYSQGVDGGISDAIPVTVVSAQSFGNNLDDFTSVDIGEVGAAGDDSYDESNGTLISQGAGHIGILNTSSEQKPDVFHFNYTEVEGDFEFTAQVDNLAKLDYQQQSGLMIRASLDPSSEFYMGSLTYIKGEDYEGRTDISGESYKAKNMRSVYRSSDGENVGYGNMLGVAAVRADKEPNHGTIKLARIGDEITISASNDGGINWYELNSYTTTLPQSCYVGFATDAAQDKTTLVKYNVTEFSNISLVPMESYDVLYGDVNCDGEVTTADAAMLMQYVLTGTGVTDDGLENAKVTDEDTITSVNVAHILQKALDSSYLMPIERD